MLHDLLSGNNDEKEAERNDEEEKKEIEWSTVLTNKHAIFAIILGFVGTFNVMYYKVFMVIDLTDKRREEPLEEYQAGYLISIPAISYLIGCYTYQRIGEHWPRKILFFVACLGFGF